MIVASWNVRGFNKIYNQKEIKNYISQNNIVLLALIETRAQEKYAKKIVHKVFGNWNWANN